MEMLGKIRRMYFRDKLSLHQIAKRTGLSTNTIRKRVRAPQATQPAYQRCATFQERRDTQISGIHSVGLRADEAYCLFQRQRSS